MTDGHHLPKMIGLLPSSAVAKHLSRGVQTGAASPPIASLVKSAAFREDSEARWRIEPVRDLLIEAMERFDGKRASADGWLAPRLHATLRMSRNEAANEQIWNYLALVGASDYVVWRHKSVGVVQPSRFSGPHYTQTFSRLWWAAELFRDGDDYRPVEVACGAQDVLNTTMRLDVIDHRPTAHAILRIVEKLIAGGTPNIGDQVNALSSAVNAAGSTLLYDVLAPDTSLDDEAVSRWIDDAQYMAPVLWEILPDGPYDGRVAPSSVDSLIPLFEELLDSAPKRKRSRHSVSSDAEVE